MMAETKQEKREAALAAYRAAEEAERANVQMLEIRYEQGRLQGREEVRKEWREAAEKPEVRVGLQHGHAYASVGDWTFQICGFEGVIGLLEHLGHRVIREEGEQRWNR